MIGEQNYNLANLGTRVQAYDWSGLYATLGTSAGNPARPGLLNFNSTALHGAVTAAASGGPLLFALCAEGAKGAVDKAIGTRENSYYQKYVNKSGIANVTQQFFKPSAAAPPAPQQTKPDRLEALAANAQSQHDQLGVAYLSDLSMGGVVTTTTTDTVTLPNTLTYTGDVSTTSKEVTNLSSVAFLAIGTPIAGTGIPTGTTITGIFPGTKSITVSNFTTANAKQTGLTMTFTGTRTHSDTLNYNPTSTVTGKSHSDNSSDPVVLHAQSRGYSFRHPILENESQHQRAQVSLIDERFSQFMFSQSLPYISVMFDNELSAIDLEVKRLQLGYLSTILVSPISGVVTGLFCDLGDWVQAGQPVMRVENGDEILIVGTIKFRGLLKVGSLASITTAIFDSPTQMTISGVVSAIRGHDSEDELWDVIIRCPNLDTCLRTRSFPSITTSISRTPPSPSRPRRRRVARELVWPSGTAMTPEAHQGAIDEPLVPAAPARPPGRLADPVAAARSDAPGSTVRGPSRRRTRAVAGGGVSSMRSVATPTPNVSTSP